MKGTFYCYFCKQIDDGLNMISFSILNSMTLMPQNEFDYAYYIAKNKCVYFRESLKLQNLISDPEIETFYKEMIFLHNKIQGQFCNIFYLYLFIFL
jgi:hypothetical protein